MAEISLELIDMHDTDDWLIRIEGIYSYLNRKPSVTPGLVERLNESMYDGVLKKIYHKALQEYSRLSGIQTRYYELAPSVFVDAANSLELMGLMNYDKSFTYSYNLFSSLDFCLGCIFNEDTQTVRSRLEQRCEKFGITYADLSFAILSGDMNLLRNVNMQVFINLTESLNECINQIFINPQTFVYAQGDRFISLADPLHTPESRIATFIIHKVLFFAQTMLNAIIAQFRDRIPPFVESAKGMLVSKGPSNVVLTGKQIFTPTITFSSGKNIIVLRPQVFREIGV